MIRALKYTTLFVFLCMFLVPCVHAGELSAEYLYGRWVIDAQDCSSPDSEYIEFHKNGTFQSTRTGETEVVGFWVFNRDILELHMLTSPAFFDDIHKALAAFGSLYDYFQAKVVIFNNKENSFEAIGLLGNEVKRATAVRCK